MADETRQEQAIARVPLKASDEGTLAIIPRDFEGAWRMAQVVVAGKMAPKSFEGSVERVCLAIMHGLEVGLTPMAALQSIAVVNGMPTIWGDGMLGLVQRSGLLEKFEEQQESDEQGPTIATCRVRRRGATADIVGVFTRAEAQKAGLWKKEGPWQNYPRRMMQMRARSWALRDGFADVLRGLQATEEALDIPRDVTAQGSVTTAPAEPRRGHVSEHTIHDVAPTHPTSAPPVGTADPQAAEAGGSPTPTAGQPEGNQPERSPVWTIPAGLLGQDAILKGLYEMLSLTRSQGDVDQLLEQNAERIAKITGTKGSQWRFDVQTRRTLITQGTVP